MASGSKTACENCIHYEVCPLGLIVDGATGTCLAFKDKSKFVEVVMCKECRFWNNTKGFGENKSHICIRELMWNMPLKEPTDFCSKGERRTDNV